MQELIEQFNVAAKQGIDQLSGALIQFAEQAAEKIASTLGNPIAAAIDDEAYPLDAALWKSAPTVAVPKHAKFAQLQEPGHRFLVTADGLYVEILRPWLHLIRGIAPLGEPAMRPPYGAVASKIELAFGRLSAAFPMVRQFIDAARTAAPAEHAAWVVWNDTTRALEYRELGITSASAGAVSYDRPTLEPHASLALDLHSHGCGEAFFSGTDDRDDAGEVKISCVVGNLTDGMEPTIQFRLCALGMTLPLNVPVATVLGDA